MMKEERRIVLRCWVDFLSSELNLAVVSLEFCRVETGQFCESEQNLAMVNLL